MYVGAYSWSSRILTQYAKSSLQPYNTCAWYNNLELSFIEGVTPGHRSDQLKINLDMEKEQISGILFFLGEKVLFKESPLNIMVTRNPNWSTEIL
jgi:hypothetical protein